MDNAVASTRTSCSTVEGAARHNAKISGKGSRTDAVPGTGRAVVDTSAPFESVKEAVDRFGGSAIWKSQKLHSVEELELLSVQKQAAQLKNDLIIKEQEALEVLMELERTKRTVDSLKLRLHEEASGVDKFHETRQDGVKFYPAIKHDGDFVGVNSAYAGDFVGVNSAYAGLHAKHSPGPILVELAKAKMNLTRTSNLADVQASIESLQSEIQEEKTLLVKTREKLSSKRAIISCLEDELKQMNFMLHLAEEAKDKCNADPMAISVKIKKLISQREWFRQAAEAAKLEVLGLTSEIDKAKASVKTTEIRWLAARKMEQAAKAAEAVAIAQTLVLHNNNCSTACLTIEETVVLSIEEHASLTRRIEEADESLTKKIEAAMVDVERANQSKLELMSKIEEAEADVKTNREFLEEALTLVEAANTGKLAVEEALRSWRAENAQKRRCIHNNAKFKNSCPSVHRRDSRMLDLNGLTLVNDDPCDRPNYSLSIGEILSRKLIGPGDHDYDDGRNEISNGKIKVSLGQILNRKAGALSPQNGCGGLNQHSSMRKKFGFVGFTHLLRNGRMKRKKDKKRVSVRR